MKRRQSTLLVAQRATKEALDLPRGRRLTDTMQGWRSPLWLARHPWFATELLPVLRERVALSPGDSSARRCRIKRR